MGVNWENRFKNTLTIAAVTGGFLAAAGNILYDYGINRRQRFLFGPLKQHKQSVAVGEFMRMDISEETMTWAEKTAILQKETKSYDGISLNAYCFEQKNPSHRWLIAVHGYGQAAAGMFTVAKPFYEAGFHVLLPECRGCGHSEGNYYGLGWKDRLDVLRWCYQIISEDPRSEIVLYGVSTGAAAAVMASGEENFPANVRCIIADSAYSRLTDLVSYCLKHSRIPAAGVLTFAASLVTGLRAGYTFTEASVLNQVALSRTPTFFIHGEEDELLPVEMSYELYEAASCPKDLMVISEAGHGYAIYADYEQYWNRIWKFVGQYCPVKAEEKSYRERLMNQVRRFRHHAE